MNKSNGERKEGVTFLEMCASVAVIAVLLGLAVPWISMARDQAHVVQAINRLRQIALGLDLYYNKYGIYPPAGKDLSEELDEFIADKSIFENPLKDETKPGRTLSVLYQEPTTQELDQPGTYLTAFAGDDGKTAVVLEANGKVVVTDDLNFTPGDDTDAKVEVMTLIQEEADENEDGGLDPSLAIFIHYAVNTKSNKGHGNNDDHDDFDNPGNGGGDHGTEEGFVPDDSVGYDDDDRKTLRTKPLRVYEGVVTFGIVNTTVAPNDAAGVCVDVEILEGGQYVKSLDYTREIGDLAAGESKPFTFDVRLNNTWDKAAGSEVLLAVTITAEAHSLANVGRKVKVLIVK
jgi:type II secretory pathway pseudopilin PulG